MEESIKLRDLSEEELEHIEIFFECAQDIIGTTLKAPIRVSHSVGDLNMHLYIDSKEMEKSS